MHPSVTWAAGIDAGRSAVKAVACSMTDDELCSIVFPNYCILKPAISDPKTLDAVAPDTVVIGETTYLVGRSAETLGDPSSVPVGMDDEWFMSPQHAAMIVAALNKFEAVNPLFTPSTVMLTVGLPVSLAISQHSAKRYIDTLSAHLAKAGMPKVTKAIQSQARGPLYDLSFGDNGVPLEQPILEGNWAVIEVGHYSTDCIVIRDGLTLDKEHVSLPGMRSATSHISDELRKQSIMATVQQLNSVIERGSYKLRGAMIDMTAQRDIAVRKLAAELAMGLAPLLRPHLDNLDGVILAGGGAELLQQYLVSALPPISVPVTPRFSVARGFAKHSAFLSHMA